MDNAQTDSMPIPVTHVIDRSPARIVVLVSGSGTNMQALVEACQDPGYGAQVVAVGADVDCPAIEWADRRGIPTFVHRLRDFDTREAWNSALSADTVACDPDLVVCAGFMKLLSEDFLNAVECPTLNTHNSLLPSFPGVHGPADAVAYGVKYSGATLFIVDPGVDTGLVVAQTVVPVMDSDDADSLLERIKGKERRQLVEAVGKMVRGGWTITGRRVSLALDATGE